MVEEDRQTALSMYSRLFDNAQDEEQLMDLLVSPTRQAVVIARTYDARERKQQLESPKPEDHEQTPAFVLAIDKIYQQVAPKAPEPRPLPEEKEEGPVSQFSLFPDDAHPIDDSEYVPFQIEAQAVPLEPGVEELPEESPVRGAEKAEESYVPAHAEPLPIEEEKPAPAEEPQPQPEPTPEERYPVQPVSKEPEVPQPAAPEKNTVSLNAADYDLDFIPETRHKTRVFLLILYILLAIPVTLAGIALLLIPTALALCLAVAVIVLGSAALVTAFSGFPKLADILIVLGTAVIVLALGLLLLWLFVWFIGGAICGLIRAVIALGRKWCIVEVPV